MLPALKLKKRPPVRLSRENLPVASGGSARCRRRPLIHAFAAIAAASSTYAAATDVPSLVSTGSPPNVPACSSCHGAAGEGNAAAGFPRLAGIGSSYIASQLSAFAAGTRPDPVMGPIAKALNSDQKQAVSIYYAALPSAFTHVIVNEADVQPAVGGAWLANRGRWNDGLAACVGCHGSGGAGVSPTFPPLAGQSAAYLAAQLNGWKAGKRPPGPMGLMSHVAAKLDATDIRDVSQYFATLRPVAPATPKNLGRSK